ncbi:hypothetical protein E3P86_02485, partial [Wallemia ichthyophaga]
ILRVISKKKTLENGSNDEETIYRLFAAYGNLLCKHKSTLDKATVGGMQEIVDVVSITQQPQRIKDLSNAFTLY